MRAGAGSIRAYLLTRSLGGAALVLAAAGVAVYLFVVRSLEAQFDANLTDRAQAFASILFQVGDEVEFEFSDELMPEYERAELPAYFQLWFADGRLLERSNSLGGGDLEVPIEPGPEPRHWSAPLPDGRPGRYVAVRMEVHHVYPEEGPDRPRAAAVRVVVARGREELVAASRSVLVACAVVALVVMLLIGLSTWRAVARGLEPALRLARALDRIDVDDLPERLDAGALPAELVPVAEKTDALVRRVDAALARERRTSADIAHELRTPISEMVTVSEVALRDGEDARGAHSALRTLRDVAWRMGRSVSTLLALARLEAGVERFERSEVDLGALVAEALRSRAAVRRERGLRVENGVSEGDRVDGDEDVLRIVVSNLVGNALDYAPAGSRVGCRLERAGSAWRLAVENPAPDLRAEDLDALSEPFWRKDRARSDRSRSGLGLALSRALAARAGLRLGFELEEGTFRATLAPADEPAAGNGRATAAGPGGRAGRARETPRR